MSSVKDTIQIIQRLLLLGAGLSLLGVSILAFRTPPAIGYEWSIYRAFPLLFWVLLVAGLVASLLVILLATEDGNPYWRHAFLLIIFLYLIYLLLPLFRGYYLYGRGSTDVFAHIGYTKTILATGAIASNDWYPVVHFLLAALQFAQVPLNVGPTIVSALLVELYIVGLFLYVRQEFSGRTRVIATLASIVPLLFQRFLHTTHPAMLSFFLFPYVLLTYKRLHQSESPLRQAFLLLLLAPVIVLFHPLTTLIVIAAFVVLFVSDHLYRLAVREKALRQTELPIALLFFGLFLAWQLSFERTRRNFWHVFLVLNGQLQSQSIAGSKVAEAQAAPSTGHLLWGLVESYGPIFIFATIAGLGLLVILAQIKRNEPQRVFAQITGSYRYRPHHVDVEFAMQFVAGAGIAVLFILLPLIVSNPVRISRYMIVMSSLLTGAVLTHLLEEATVGITPRKVVLGCIVLLVIVSVPLSVMGSYNTGKHMTSWTETDHHGTGWLINNRMPDTYAVSYDSSDKVVRYHLGQERAERVFVPYNATTQFPEGFGYGTHESVGATFEGDGSYLVTKDYDQSFYMTQRPYLHASARVYTESDLERLSSDETVSKIYTNGGYQTWFVGSTTD